MALARPLTQRPFPLPENAIRGALIHEYQQLTRCAQVMLPTPEAAAYAWFWNSHDCQG